MTLNLADLLSPQIVRQELDAPDNADHMNGDDYKHIVNMTDAEIQAWIEKVNPDFNYARKENKTLNEHIKTQISFGAYTVISAIVSDLTMKSN